jgi:SOS response regulatory protein OraA/RecX
MGGPSKAFKKLVNKGVEQKIIKPVLKTPEEGKKTSEALDNKLAENAEQGNEEAIRLLNKRKGRRSTIKTTASGLNEDEKIKQKTLLG